MLVVVRIFRERDGGRRGEREGVWQVHHISWYSIQLSLYASVNSSHYMHQLAAVYRTAHINRQTRKSITVGIS